VISSFGDSYQIAPAVTIRQGRAYVLAPRLGFHVGVLVQDAAVPRRALDTFRLVESRYNDLATSNQSDDEFRFTGAAHPELLGHRLQIGPVDPFRLISSWRCGEESGRLIVLDQIERERATDQFSLGALGFTGSSASGDDVEPVRASCVRQLNRMWPKGRPAAWQRNRSDRVHDSRRHAA